MGTPSAAQLLPEGGVGGAEPPGARMLYGTLLRSGPCSFPAPRHGCHQLDNVRTVQPFLLVGHYLDMARPTS